MDAVVAALTAANAHPYTLDDIKQMATAPAYYTEVTVSRRFGGERRGGNASGSTGWRVTTRAVAKTEENAREMRRRAASLEDARLGTSTPVVFETEEAIGEDNDWWSGLTTWTYVT